MACFGHGCFDGSGGGCVLASQSFLLEFVVTAHAVAMIARRSRVQR